MGDKVELKELDSFLKDLGTKLGDVNIGRISNMQSIDVETIPTGSLMLDSILGGGIPVGRIVEIYGAESSGKTSLALTMAGNVQKKGGVAAFLDVEQAFDRKYAEALGVDTANLIFAQPETAEEALNIVLQLCKSKLVDIVILDSIASMIPKEELENNLGKPTIGLLARLLSQGLKQIAVAAGKNKCTVVFTNQIRDNIGSFYGPQYDTTGGRAMKFYASQRIEAKRKERIEEDGEVIGNKVLMRCIKNKIAPPFGEATTVLTFAKGINQAAEILVLGEDTGVIEKKGRTYYYTPNEEHADVDISGYGAEKQSDGSIKIGVNIKPVTKELEDNAELARIISEEVKELLLAKFGLKTEEGDTSEEYDE